MKEQLKKSLLAIATTIFYGVYTLPIYAGNLDASDLNASDLDLSWLNNKGNGTFDEAMASFQGIFASGYALMMVVASGMMVFFLILAAIMYAGGSARSKDDAKGKIFGVFIGCFLLFGAVAIVTLIAGIATGAFS